MVDQLVDLVNQYGLSWTLSAMLAVAFGVFLTKLLRRDGWIDTFVAKQFSLMNTLETSLKQQTKTTVAQAAETKAIGTLLHELKSQTADDEAARRRQVALWIEGLKQAAQEWGWPQALVDHLATAEAELLK